jgi:hypothetical protein
MRPYPETEVGPWGMAHVTEHMPGPGASLTSNPVHTHTHTHTHTQSQPCCIGTIGKIP